jgi:hypothetical protein
LALTGSGTPRSPPTGDRHRPLYPALIEKVGLTTLWTITTVVSLGALAVIVMVMTLRQWSRSLVAKYPAMWPLSCLVTKMLGTLVAYHQYSGVFAASTAVSILCHSLGCVAFYLCVR